MRADYYAKVLLMTLSLTMLSACSSLLPTETQHTISPWRNFETAKATFEKVVPGKTTVQELANLGYNPYTVPNIKIENYLWIRQNFDPYQTGYNVPASVARCLAAQDSCLAYVVTAGFSKDKRVGNVLLDLANFKRETYITSWSFNAIFVINSNIVVYKTWTGNPITEIHKKQINPLGPIQGITNYLYGIPSN